MSESVARRRSRSSVGARPSRLAAAPSCGAAVRGFRVGGAAFAALRAGRFGAAAARLTAFFVAALAGAFAAFLGAFAFFDFRPAGFERFATGLAFGRAVALRDFAFAAFDALVPFERDLAIIYSFTLTG